MVNKGKFEDVEFMVLSILYTDVAPLGAGTIRELLEERGVALGEATVGRILKRLDSQRFVERVGFQGRRISEEGRKRYGELSLRSVRNKSAEAFIDALKGEGGQHLHDVLVARRALESEAAALAARNATLAQIEEMRAILQEMDLLLSSGRSMAATDREFHKKIARASGNKVLEYALDVIRQNGEDSNLVEFIRCSAGSAIGRDHKEIFKAIEKREEERSRLLMTAHLNNILEDLNRFEEDQRGRTMNAG